MGQAKIRQRAQNLRAGRIEKQMLDYVAEQIFRFSKEKFGIALPVDMMQASSDLIIQDKVPQYLLWEDEVVLVFTFQIVGLPSGNIKISSSTIPVFTMEFKDDAKREELLKTLEIVLPKPIEEVH